MFYTIAVSKVYNLSHLVHLLLQSLISSHLIWTLIISIALLNLHVKEKFLQSHLFHNPRLSMLPLYGSLVPSSFTTNVIFFHSYSIKGCTLSLCNSLCHLTIRLPNTFPCKKSPWFNQFLIHAQAGKVPCRYFLFWTIQSANYH